MKNTPTNLHDLDHQFSRQHCSTTTVRPLPILDNYNPYYPDPDFGFDPYWDIRIYNQHHLYFCINFTEMITDIDSDLRDIDQNLNTTLSKALVDPWQGTRVALYPTTHDESTTELPKVGSLVALTATVEEPFVNTLISQRMAILPLVVLSSH